MSDFRKIVCFHCGGDLNRHFTGDAMGMIPNYAAVCLNEKCRAYGLLAGYGKKITAPSRPADSSAPRAD